jgi:hypothetical protein
MPRIPVYQNNVYPNASPVAEAAAGAARTGYYIGNIYRRAGNDIETGVNKLQSGIEARQAAEEQAKTAQEIGAVTAGMAETQAKLAAQWRETLSGADPNDPNTAENFINDVVTPAFDALGQNLSTDKARNYFAVARAKGWGTAYKSAAADQANLLAKGAVDQVNTVAKNYSDAAYYDPSNWKAHMDQAGDAVKVYQESHNLRPVDAIALKTQFDTTIAKAAAAGMIAQNPDVALEAVQKGEFNGVLGGEDIAKIEKQADAAIKARTSNQSAELKAAQAVKKTEGYKVLNDLESKVKVDPATGETTVPTDYFTSLNEARGKYGDVIPDGTFRAAQNWGSAEIRRNSKTIETASDPSLYKEFTNNAISGQLTVADVYEARANGTLSNKDFTFFKGWVGEGGKAGTTERTELKDMSSYLKTFKGYIDTSLGGVYTDTWGTTRFAEFNSDMMQQWQEAKAKGMTADQFKTYVRTAIPAYTFKDTDLQAEITKNSSSLSPEPPPEVTPPLLGEKRPPLSQLFDGDNIGDHVLNSFQPDDTGRNIPSLVGGKLPVKTGTQAGRQSLDMSHMNPAVISKWERVQGMLGYQVPVVSAFRDATKNALAGGANKSQHLHGNAIDLDVSKLSKFERLRIIQNASAAGFTGVGVYENSIHLDTGGRRAWGPSHGHESVPTWAAKAIAGHIANVYNAAPEDEFGARG